MHIFCLFFAHILVHFPHSVGSIVTHFSPQVQSFFVTVQNFFEYLLRFVPMSARVILSGQTEGTRAGAAGAFLTEQGKGRDKPRKRFGLHEITDYWLMVAFSASIEVCKPASTVMVRSSISRDT